MAMDKRAAGLLGSGHAAFPLMAEGVGLLGGLFLVQVGADGEGVVGIDG
jgi:hypothetical protein